MEHFPFVDSLWFGEGFNYNEPPDYWLVEISGIPFGLFGEMLHGGGNPWRGMLYGMTSRLGWSGDPRGIWKVWDEFGIDKARMIGYWDPSSPVRTGHEDVLATAYVRERGTLISLASWAKKLTAVELELDLDALEIDRQKAHLYAPPARGFQPEALFELDGAIPVPPGRGWLLLLDEKIRELPPPVDPRAGRRVLVDERFDGKALEKSWKVHLSSRPATRVAVLGGELVVKAAANSAAFAERPLPAGVRLVFAEVDPRSDQGASWGPGVSLVWAGGKVLRINVRAEGRFGVDDGKRQILEGFTVPDVEKQLVIRLDDEEIIAEASRDGRLWQEIARLPRPEFPGDPAALRVGKMSPGSRNEDFSEPGPAGECAILGVQALGPAQ
jgi:hypothetical protein